MVGTGTVTALFTDLVGSTELLEQLGDDAAQVVYRTHFELLREAISAAGGQEVKSLGDGLMVVFPSALDAVGCAVAMQRAIDLHNRTSDTQPLSVRVGLHAGEPIREADDYFGTTVVVARRLCDSAEGGQIVVSDVVRILVGSRGGFSFRPLGTLSLKGLAEPVPACEVRWRTDAPEEDVRLDRGLGARRLGFLRRPPLPVIIGLPIVVLAGLVGGVIALTGSSDETAISGVTGADVDMPMAEKAMDAVTDRISKLAVIPESTAEPLDTIAPSISLEKALGALTALSDSRARMGKIETAEQTVARARKNVTELRAIAPQAEPKSVQISSEQMASIARELFDREHPLESVLAIERLLDALHVTDVSDQLQTFLEDVKLLPTYALFDDRSETLYVLGDVSEIGPADELEYAGAYASALRSQLFDLDELRIQAGKLNGDRSLAVAALIGGDALRTRQAYKDIFLADDLVVKMAGFFPEGELVAAPMALRSLVRFVEQQGTTFVTRLFESTGDWDAINAAYGPPPSSTEQILHPEKYLAGEEPFTVDVPDLSADLGDGWVQAGSGVMGEFLMRAHLAAHLDEERASSAAAGWGGDRYSLFIGPEGERILALLSGWDSLVEASEFSDGYRDFWETKTGGSGGVTLGEGSWKMVSSEATVFLGLKGLWTLLIVADTEPLAGRALELIAGF